MADAIKNTFKQGSESIQGALSGASKEGNKGNPPTSASPSLSNTNTHGFPEVAKGHTDASATTRLTAAKDAASDKLDEKKHDTKSDVYANK